MLKSFHLGMMKGMCCLSRMVESVEKGSRFTVTGLIDAEFTIPVYGSHQVKNTLAAILIANEFGVSTDDIRTALSKASLTDMRMQPIIAENGALFINDAYNAAPTSMRAALTSLMKRICEVISGSFSETCLSLG